MSVIARAWRFAVGLTLFAHCNRRLDFNQLAKNKRIAVVGAADSVFKAEKGLYIDGFDLVIRINKAPYVLSDGKWKLHMGTKTDVLFHSFFENETSGGGALNLELYDRIGIKFIVNPVSTYPGLRTTLNFYKKYLTKRITFRLPRQEYLLIEEKLKGFRPTIGFCALSTAIQSEFAELYITGFTFFKTAFAAGYRDDMKEAGQVQQFIRKAGLHDPDLEFKCFLDLLQANRNKNIVLDSTLRSIVENHRQSE